MGEQKSLSGQSNHKQALNINERIFQLDGGTPLCRIDNCEEDNAKHKSPKLDFNRFLARMMHVDSRDEKEVKRIKKERNEMKENAGRIGIKGKKYEREDNENEKDEFEEKTRKIAAQTIDQKIRVGEITDTCVIMAGLWDNSCNEASFTILTMKSQGTTLECIHRRCPVMLDRESAGKWLDDLKPFESLKHDILQRSVEIACKLLCRYEVTRNVGNMRYNFVDATLPLQDTRKQEGLMKWLTKM